MSGKKSTLELSEIQERAMALGQAAAVKREQAKQNRAAAKRLEEEAFSLEAEAAELNEYILMIAHGGPVQVTPSMDRHLTRTERIRDVLSRRPERDFTVEELTKAIGEDASARDAVRATVSLLVRKGVAERRGRGVYRWRS